MAETTAHRRLKRSAIAFLRARGCAAAAVEVHCPIRRFRVDAAGYADGAGRPTLTHVIECKQARSDFVRETEDAPTLLRRRDELERIARSIERHRVMVEEPHLRGEATTLFAELDEWDFARSRLPAYRRTLEGLRRLERRLHGHCKFSTLARYRLADRLWLLAPRGLVRRGEVPRGWGLLECPAPAQVRNGEAPPLTVRVEAPELGASDRHRVRLLRNIAVAAGRRRGQIGRPHS